MTDTVATYPAGAGVTERLENLTYAPLPWQTHPIDTASGSQGWGPMDGPYTPFNFLSAKDSQSGGSGIDITWQKGDNTPQLAPPYSVLTLMQDKSIDLVANNGFMGNLLKSSNANANVSTIAQANTVQLSGVAPTPQGNAGFWQSLSALISGRGQRA